MTEDFEDAEAKVFCGGFVSMTKDHDQQFAYVSCLTRSRDQETAQTLLIVMQTRVSVISWPNCDELSTEETSQLSQCQPPITSATFYQSTKTRTESQATKLN